jgi:hypothetical protein
MAVTAKETCVDTSAVSAAYDIRMRFERGVPPEPEELAQLVGIITTKGTANTSVVALAGMPAKPEYEQVRRTLLARVLLRPQKELLRGWVKRVFCEMDVLPGESQLIEQYFDGNRARATELLGKRKIPPYLKVLDGGRKVTN